MPCFSLNLSSTQALSHLGEEKKYPDDYIEFSENGENGNKVFTWCFPIRNSSNGTYCEFTIRDSGISLREKELWDGAEMKDETKIFSFADYRNGLTGNWVKEKLGERAEKQIAGILEKQYGIGRIKTAAESPAGQKEQKENTRKPSLRKRMLGSWYAALPFALFGIFIGIFPASRLVVTLPQRFAWDIAETKAEVSASGLSSRESRQKNTKITAVHAWAEFRYKAEGQELNLRLEDVDYDSTIEGEQGKYWLNTYPPGKNISLLYYAGHAQYAGLSRESLVPGWGGILLDLLLLLFGLLCLYLGIGSLFSR